MGFLEELKDNVQVEPIYDEDRYYDLLEKIKSLKTLPESEARDVLIDTINYTGSWISSSDLSKMLADENYTRIEQDVRNDISSTYDNARQSHLASEDKIAELIQQGYEETSFAIRKMEDKYKIKVAPYSLTEYDLDVDGIDVEVLKDIIITSMERHLKVGVFHDQKGIKAEWIKNVLARTIKELSIEQQEHEEIKE